MFCTTVNSFAVLFREKDENGMNFNIFMLLLDAAEMQQLSI